MSNHYIVVNKSTFQIMTEYFGEKRTDDANFPEEECVHLQVAGDAVVSYLRVSYEKGKWSIYEDGTKRREYLQSQLQQLKDNVRNKRNMLLAQSDWIVSVPDAPFTDVQKTAWKKYRQLLRDLPKSITRPDQDIKWPTPPS